MVGRLRTDSPPPPDASTFQLKHYLESARTKQYRQHWWVKYISPLTGKQKRLSMKITGHLPTEATAEVWVKENLPRIVKAEIAAAERQQWRKHALTVQVANEYAAYKRKAAPRSAQQEISVLFNFVLPYFVVEQQLTDPNSWFKKHMKFKSWLLEGAQTDEGEPISVSTANKAINALNKFSEWMRDFEYLDHDNFRSLKAYPARMQNTKGADDLVDDDEFNLVHEALKKLYKEKHWADMWYVQRNTGLRANELVGLQFNAIITQIPEEVSAPFIAAGYKIYGGILLESQPAKPYVKRVDGEIPRGPLKWRDTISPENSRLIPIVDKDTWNILARRFAEQKALFLRREFGPKKNSYLLFDGAQRTKYLEALRQAYAHVGLRFKGSHVLRHTIITKWTMLKLHDKIMELIFGNKAQAREKYTHIVEILNRRARESADMDLIKEVS